MAAAFEETDFFDPAFPRDPHPVHAGLRREAPVWRDPRSGVVMVSSHAMILEVNRQPLLLSNNIAARLQSGSAAPPDPEEIAILKRGVRPRATLLTADPPEHTRYRKLVMKAFTHKRVEAMGPYIAQVAHGLIDAFADAGRCDFKAAFAAPLPMIVIADTLGAARADMDRFHLWSEALMVSVGGVSDRATRLAAAERVVAFQHYFLDVIARKRAHPDDDVISDLVHADLAEEGDARTLDDAALLSIIQQLLVAGNETTANALAAGLITLIDDPALAARLRADPALVPAFVEETVRLFSPVSNLWRLATAETELGGVAIRPGDHLLLRYSSANRDEARFAEPDRLSLDREDGRGHLAFGAGIHTCLGAQLARKEMTTAFPILLERLANPRLAAGETPRLAANVLFNGVAALDVCFDPAPSAATRG